MGPGGKTRNQIKQEMTILGIKNPQLGLLKKFYLVDGENRPGDQLRFYEKFSNDQKKEIIKKSNLEEASKNYYNSSNQNEKNNIRKNAFEKIDTVILELEKTLV